MSMTDKDLCEAVLGWKRLAPDSIWWWNLEPPPVHVRTPNFAHNIEAVMKLARAACEKWDLHYSLSEIYTKALGWHIWAAFYPMETGGTRCGDCKWSASKRRHEEAAAIRAAVVLVAEAHAAKE